MTEGLGDGAGPLVHGADWTGAVDKCWGGGLSVIFAMGKMVPLGGNAVGVSSGTLREGAGKYGWKTTAGAGRGALVAGAVGGLAVTLEKFRESFWMADNWSSPSIANGVGSGYKRASASAQVTVVAELVELLDGTEKL